MSIENGERFIRLLKQDKALREKVREDGESNFLDISAAANASCTPFEVVAAFLRELD